LSNPEAVRANLQNWFALLNAGFRFTGVGNSDSHRALGQWAGYPRSYVRVSNDAPEQIDPLEVVKGLKAGRVMVTNGPFLRATIDGKEPGDLVVAQSNRVHAKVRVDNPTWISAGRLEIIINGEAMQLPADKRTLSRSTDLEVAIDLERDSWVLVMVRGELPLESILPGRNAMPLALTNPIFVDVDGDGTFTASRQQKVDHGKR
jgi:hypothetical protein